MSLSFILVFLCFDIAAFLVPICLCPTFVISLLYIEMFVLFLWTSEFFLFLNKIRNSANRTAESTCVHKKFVDLLYATLLPCFNISSIPRVGLGPCSKLTFVDTWNMLVASISIQVHHSYILVARCACKCIISVYILFLEGY